MLLLAVAVVMFQGQVPAQTSNSDSPSALVQKMLQHYADAKTMVGTVMLTQKAQGAQVQVLTELQFEKPSKIFIRQTKAATGSSPAQSSFLQSNGDTFSFTKPANVLGHDNVFKEKVTQHGDTQNVQDLYGVFRATAIDASAPIEVAIGRHADLKALMAQWATMRIYGKVDLNGEKVTAIVGDYREELNQETSGSFEAYINDAGDFVKYVLKQKFGVPGHNDQVVDVVSIWDSTLKVDGKPDPALFRG